MSTFKDTVFTTQEFARMAKIDKDVLRRLEDEGLLEVSRKRVGNVERKMVSLESVQRYFHQLRQKHNENQKQNTQTDAAATASNSQIENSPQSGETEIGRQGDHAKNEESTRLLNSFFLQKPLHKIQMFYNVKGGTGKSTISAQYVMRAAMMGYRILAVDLDGQGHMSVNLDVLDAHERPTVYDVLINDLPITDAILNVAPGLDLVPANLGLCNIEIPLNHKPRREYRLSEAIRKVADQYDLIVADTNPAASILNSSMLVAADLVNVVCATNPLSFHGMSLVITTIEEMEREFNRKLNVRIIPNMYDNREIISQEVLGELREHFPDLCAKAVVNRSADMNEATKRRTTVMSVNPRGTAAQDISSLTEELIFS